ncbi:MAG: divergent PAP2 family protein [Treponema sp.]|nr:divergent PAP2 family protein [Treponema sp.]
MPTKYEKIMSFFTNPIFLSGVFSWLGAQFLKTLIQLIYGRIKSLKDLIENMLWKTGGMPSSHSAVVTAITTCIGIKEGVQSSVFMLAIMITFITMRDAVGVRRSSGLQSQKINELGRELEKNECLQEYKPIKEVNGHTPMQVIMGSLLGVLIGFSMMLLK